MKTYIQKDLEGNKWFYETTQDLQSKIKIGVVEIKIIIAEAILQYLIKTISFHMFIEIIDRVGERNELKTSFELEEIITSLLSLSQYGPYPQAKRKHIIICMNDVVNKLEKSRKLIKFN